MRLLVQVTASLRNLCMDKVRATEAASLEIEKCIILSLSYPSASHISACSMPHRDDICVWQQACHRQVLACNMPSALLSLIRPLSDRPEHRELMLNITRVLSKLSLYEGIRASINEDPAHLRSAAQICVLNMLLRSADSGVIHT